MRILVLDGGGQLGAFEWGAMCELKRQGIDYSFFDYYVCTSAGAFNAAFFAAEQFEEGKRMWLEHLPSGFWKWSSNDMEFLRYALTELEHLNCDLINQRGSRILLSVTSLTNNMQEFINLGGNTDCIRALLASCARSEEYTSELQSHSFISYA